MDMIPQGFPLIAHDDDGDSYAVVGWVAAENSTELVPVLVSLTASWAIAAVAQGGPFAYSLPAVAKQ